MMEEIKIIYIDDEPDVDLDEYLDKHYNNANFRYSSLLYEPQKGYESLLKNSLVETANIIIVDSRLFTHKDNISKKITGEEFKIVLRKFYPFIEVIIVTQNEIVDSIPMIPKFDFQSGMKPTEYYDSRLGECISQCVERLNEYHELAHRLEGNQSWETVLKQKVFGTLNGIRDYDELTKTDIDTLVSAFKEIQESLNA